MGEKKQEDVACHARAEVCRFGAKREEKKLSGGQRRQEEGRSVEEVVRGKEEGVGREEGGDVRQGETAVER